ncbi:DUF3466 family protein [Motilimonas pumila]|nr:DUF3466 family protein [Motilimonas pumila]
MKFQQSLLASAIALTFSSAAMATAQEAYYLIEEVEVNQAGDFIDANFGPFAQAISDDGYYIGAFSTRSSIKQYDYGLRFQYERECYFDTTVCEADWIGSNNESNPAYENGLKFWRNAQSFADENGYDSQFFTYLIAGMAEPSQAYLPFDTGRSFSTDQVVTAVNNNGDIAGYGSAPYSASAPYVRDFVRRGFYQSAAGDFCELKPSLELTNGGYSAAYDVRMVTSEDGTIKTLVFGSASVSRPDNNDDAFTRCFNTNDEDSRNDLNQLTYCPGFNTQPWVWDVTNGCAGGSLEGESMVADPTNAWIENRDDRLGTIYSGVSLSSNESGIAVGLSTLYYRNDERGSRERAVVLKPTSNGSYGVTPQYLEKVEYDISTDYDDRKDYIRHTWAADINNSNLVVGNRAYELIKGRNRPSEFFVYNLTNDTYTTPLKDKSVLNKKQRLEGQSDYLNGASSQATAINNSGLVVGFADAPGEEQPVVNGNPRRHAAFVHDVLTQDSWLLDDLICSRNDSGVVTVPYIRISEAKDISENGQIVATAYKYPTKEDFANLVNAQPIIVKLTPNPNATGGINEQVNCFEAPEAEEDDKPYKRSGGHFNWLFLLMIPALLYRRFSKES